MQTEHPIPERSGSGDGTEVARSRDEPEHPTGRGPHPALIWVAAAAVVVLSAATLIAFTGGDERTARDGVLRLDGSGTLPMAPGPPGLQGQDLTGMPLPPASFEVFDGGTATLADFSGRPMVLNFWASWCAPCIEEMPAFERVHQAAGESVVFLGLNVQDSVERGQAMVATTGVTYELGRDPTGQVLRAVGGVTMPTTVFVDADGTITRLHSGKLDEADLRRIIADDFGVHVPESEPAPTEGAADAHQGPDR